MSEKEGGGDFERAGDRTIVGERARIWGRIVLNSAVATGVSSDEIKDMRARMNEFYGVVKKSLQMSISARNSILTRERHRIFGHDDVPF